mgnify:CR=1 FL=1
MKDCLIQKSNSFKGRQNKIGVSIFRGFQNFKSQVFEGKNVKFQVKKYQARLVLNLIVKEITLR